MAESPSIDELAARIAAIEASGASTPPGPRRIRVARPGPGPAGAPEAELNAAVGVPGAEQESEPALPVRDVEDDRGPALISLEGQEAHDEALGVLPDGTEVQPPKPKRKAKPAALAFSEAEPHQRAIELAYRLVGQRERTVQQVREKLAAKDCEAVAIEAAVAELARHGFVDDRRYARLYAEDKRRLQGWGERRIRMKLQRDGVSRPILDDLFADDEAELDAPSELEAALELLHRKQPDLSDPKVKQRMAGMLARRGIASPTVFQALREHGRGKD